MAAVEAEKLLAAADKDQVTMMEERVIVTDYFDKPIGSGSKKDTHIWDNIQAGMLHRAFSVFLFTPEGKLILQQRSGAKITFPFIWANTCCSHPLDVPSETIEADAMGVKNAARRKLEHELGIPPEDVPVDAFTWITRVHYVGSSGPEETAVWGEHEIDWILMCTPPALPRMDLNPNEVAATKAFSQVELRAWMATRHERGEDVSPWFGVMEKSGLLYRWWDAVLAKNLPPVFQRDVIHRQQDLEALAAGKAPGSVPMPTAFKACLDATTAAAASASSSAATTSSSSSSPATTACGGAGATTAPSSSPLKAPSPAQGAAAGAGKNNSSHASAAPTGTPVPTGAPSAYIPGASAQTLKQGAYGKVRIHSEPLWRQLSHLDEVWAALLFKAGFASATKVTPLPADASPSLIFCEDMLTKVSRSFAMVIQQLPDHLRTAVCVFYLVLRGLDTVEDDMTAFQGRQEEKLAHLRAFHRYLSDKSWCMDGVGEGDERALLQHFTHVSTVFGELLPVEREVIADICARMGEGMAQFAGRDLKEGTANEADYKLYCHYVAGLVGEGLSRLFVARGDEDAIVGRDIAIADDMGLFLQKTNIIRDYLEDAVDGRAFWPKSIWGRYAEALYDLKKKADGKIGGPVSGPNDAMAALNHMISDALSLVPSCLTYMERLRTQGIFRFCAIPQVMAIATLDKLTNNPDVYTGVVKIRKGQALKLMGACDDMRAIYTIFLTHTRSIAAKIPAHHTHAHAMAQRAMAQVEAICLPRLAPTSLPTCFSMGAVLLAAGVLGLSIRHLYARTRVGAWHGAVLPRITDSWDVFTLFLAVAATLYLIACAGVPLVASMGAAFPPALQSAGGVKGGAAASAVGGISASASAGATGATGSVPAAAKVLATDEDDGAAPAVATGSANLRRRY